MIDAYFQTLQSLIANTPLLTAANLQTERRSETIGVVRGDLTFLDGSQLHFREFMRTEENFPLERYTYAYHYQAPDGKLIFRYDNTSHYPHLENAPNHKHTGENEVISAAAPDLASVLAEIKAKYLE